MSTCVSCGSAVPENSRFCLSCGAALASDDQATLEFVSSGPRQAAEGSGGAMVKKLSSPSRPSDEGRFLPGRLLAGRYRIIALLGRGGMGEVYRADDLKLGQPVALKFLPRRLSDDPGRRDRFYAEVRLARQVSHPNVCRVYDVGEIDGQHYLSMEYVDGEDLASLLKRIGRLPSDGGRGRGRRRGGQALAIMALLILSWVLSRRRWLAIGISAAALTLLIVNSENLAVDLPAAPLQASVVVFMATRFGLLPLFFTFLFSHLLSAYPLTLDFSRWYAGRSLFIVLAFVGLALWSFYASFGGEPVFGGAALEEA